MVKTNKKSPRQKRARSNALEKMYELFQDPTSGESCLELRRELDRLLADSLGRTRLFQNIRLLQELRGLSNYGEFSRLVGITPSHVSRIIKGQVNPSLHVFIMIAMKLGVKTTTLLREDLFERLRELIKELEIKK